MSYFSKSLESRQGIFVKLFCGSIFFCVELLAFLFYILYRAMVKRILVLLLFSLLITPCLPHSVFSLLPSSSCNQALPLWWEIRILLISDGNYTTKEGKASYSGKYSFTIRWTGCMEKDDLDFLLYYENSELIKFKAEEKGIFPETTRTLSTKDFLDKPSFSLNYILKKGDNLHFNFIVKGFLTPLNESEHKFFLILPASEENSLESSEIDYNSFITKGSNSVFLDEKRIYLSNVKKKFTWEWDYKKWHIIQDKQVFFSNTHEVKVEIFIKPHFK